MNRRKFTRLIGVGSAAVAIVSNMPAAMANMISESGTMSTFDEEDLLNGFVNFPESAKPWTYYMWLNGNISKEGITSDLEALKRIGIGGVLIMSLGAVAAGPIRFMTPEWRALVKHTIAEANRLGMQVNMNNDAGWNSGGPWITPEFGMQKLTWTETRVSGPSNFNAQLKQGATTIDTYKEIAVLAIPSKIMPVIPDIVKRTVQKEPVSWLQNDYGQLVTAQSVTVSNPKLKKGHYGPQACELAVSADGVNFNTIRTFETGWINPYLTLKSAAIRLGKVSGRYFRLTLLDSKVDPNDLEFTLQPEAVIDLWPLKAGFESIIEHGGGSPLYAMPIKFLKQMDGMFPKADQVIDLSKMMKDNGSLEWMVPKGDWIILRIGYTPTGKTNGASASDGRGLDCDKSSRKALEIHLGGMIDKVIADARPLVGKGLTTIHTDSWESGAFNWTAKFPQEFKSRRGYDLTPWLPVMVGGRVLGSVEQSERFLWDVRRTLADMIIDNHLKYFRELAHKRGVLFTSESSGRGQFLYDPIAFQVTSDLPMGEFWNSPQDSRPRPDCKIAASAAHVANRQIAGGEAFTQNNHGAGMWTESPFFLKARGDSAFCAGLNRYYFHRTISQIHPDEKPGMTWPNVGINFDTTQTWWEPASAWIAYISRCQYLLQQGRFVADVAILTDEGAPSSAIRQLSYDKENRDDPGAITETILRRYNMLPFLPPAGYDYDYVNPGAVHDMYVKNGRVTLPHGMSYRALVLPPGERMTLKLAKRIKELVIAGATVIGMKPEKSPTLGDFAKGDAELQAISGELWGNGDERSTAKQIGKGWIFSGNATQKALNALKVLPDFECAATGPTGKLKIDYIHRRTNTTDIYFISNQQQVTVDLNCLFRVAGRQPEFWLPDTGKVMLCHAYEQQGGRTKIPLRLDPSGSVFVVFRKPIGTTKAGTAKSNFSDTRTIQTIVGAWDIHFDPKWGGPEKYQTDKLQSWTSSDDPGIKHYSGTATYKKQITIPQSSIKNGKALYLDLGEVKELAKVKLNGKDLGVLWKPPFRVEITAAAQEGNNKLEIEITNLWPNRLIADSGLPKEKQLTKGNWNPYKPDSPLLESGLIGPVTLQNLLPLQ